MSYNLVAEIKQKLTHSNIGKQLAFHRDQTSKMTVRTFIFPQTQEVSPSLHRDPISIWQLAGAYMQVSKLTGSTGFSFTNVGESGFAAGSPLGMFDLDCGFTQPSLI
jgi:hypothetical protein